MKKIFKLKGIIKYRTPSDKDFDGKKMPISFMDEYGQMEVPDGEYIIRMRGKSFYGKNK